MDLRRKLHLVIYRVRERGLEIFVRDGDGDSYELPEAASELDPASLEEYISLEAGEEASRGLAVEGDYHDIPSLKGLLLDDARRLRDRLRELPVAAGEEGSFVAVKAVAKRILPEQYRMLSELRDILVDHNSTKYM